MVFVNICNIKFTSIYCFASKLFIILEVYLINLNNLPPVSCCK